jgi:hypothetical protein
MINLLSICLRGKCFLMDLDVAQTSRLRLRSCRSARVDKRPGLDGQGEIPALCNSPNRPESVLQAQSSVCPGSLHSKSSAFRQGLAEPAGDPANELLERLFRNKRSSCRDTIALARR